MSGPGNSTLRTYALDVLRYSWRASRASTALAACLSFASAMIAPATALGIGATVSVAADGRAELAAFLGAALGVAFMAQMAASHFTYAACSNVIELTAADFADETMRLLALPTTIDHFEDPDSADIIEMIRRDEQTNSWALLTILTFAGLALQSAFTLALIVGVRLELLVLVLAAFPTLAAGPAAKRQLNAGRARSAEPSRRCAELLRLLASPQHAAEIAHGESAGMIGEEAERHARRAAAAVRSGEYGAAMRIAPARVLYGLGVSSGILVLVLLARSGHASVGDVAIAVSVLGQIDLQVGRWLVAGDQLRRLSGVAERREWLHRRMRKLKEASDVPEPQTTEEVGPAISVEGVSYDFPGKERVLHDVSFELPSGTVTALVGENGAGKSTLLALIAGLYQPTGGRVRRRSHPSVAPVFQDFQRFELLARENVGVGYLKRIDDRRAVGSAVALAGADDLIERLSAGMETMLGAAADLSGGEWQRLAVARAAMRPEPTLVLLDEPNSALDHRGEAQVLDRYAEEMRSISGAAVLVASHRLSVAEHADLVLVIAAGRIVEQGSHAFLLAQDGEYTRMYNAQRSGEL